MFRNVGDASSLKLRQEDLLELVNMNDDGPSGSIPAESSGPQIDAATFAKQLALRLNEGALKNAYAHLVLVADPQTLGRVRPLLHGEVEQRLVGELARNLTNAPLEQIEQAVG